MTVDELLARVRRFLAKHSMAPSTFGRLAVRDPSLVRQLERGRSPTARTVDKVLKFMEMGK